MPCPSLTDGFCRTRTFVRGQIIHDDHIAFVQGGGELGFDIGLESAFVHGSVEHPGGGQAITPQTGDKGLGSPVSERRVHSEPVSTRSPATQTCHFGRCSGLIQKDKPMGLEAHAGLTQTDPFRALTANLGASSFLGQQRFF